MSIIRTSPWFQPYEGTLTGPANVRVGGVMGHGPMTTVPPRTAVTVIGTRGRDMYDIEVVVDGVLMGGAVPHRRIHSAR